MPGSTYLSLHYHLVFTTKNRHPLIDPSWKARLHAYIGGLANNIDAIPEAIGGTENHVHLLLGLKATHRLCDVLREIKHESSRWIHEEIGLTEFAWQDGYSAFTVSVTHLHKVKNYVLNQEKHHESMSLEEEEKMFRARATGGGAPSRLPPANFP
jgi:REP element-mobilizing transposase RayT